MYIFESYQNSNKNLFFVDINFFNFSVFNIFSSSYSIHDTTFKPDVVNFT